MVRIIHMCTIFAKVGVIWMIDALLFILAFLPGCTAILSKSKSSEQCSFLAHWSTDLSSSMDFLLGAHGTNQGKWREKNFSAISELP